MAKIDELSELLVEELNEFKLQITKLERLSEKVQTITLKPELSEMNNAMNIAVQKQDEIFQKHNSKLDAISKRLLLSNSYPKWFLTIICVTLIGVSVITTYSIYNIQNITEIKKKEYQKGQVETIKHFHSFLESNEQTKEAYLKWHQNNKQ